jgi:hypothetical protein
MLTSKQGKMKIEWGSRFAIMWCSPIN